MDDNQEYDVFVCDDDVELLTILSDELEFMSLKSKSFDQPMKLLEAINQTCPKLILTDLHMPRMSGFELASTLRERDIKIPVVLITGDITSKYVEHLKLIPNCYHLPKPFFTNEFQAIVRKALEQGLTSQHD